MYYSECYKAITNKDGKHRVSASSIHPFGVIFFTFLFTIIFTVYFSFFSNHAYSQTSYFKNYSVEDGLPFINVHAIFQDSKGNLWTGSYGGLSKFDGISFTNYGAKDGLINHDVKKIIEDKKGNLWIGTSGGVSKYNPSIAHRTGGNSFVNYTVEEGLTNNYVNTIIIDSKGILWFGTKGGVSKYDDKTFTTFSEKDGLICNDVLAILEDSKGNYWFGTQKGISKYLSSTRGGVLPDTTSWGSDVGSAGSIGLQNFSVENGLCDNRVNAIFEDRDGSLWFGTQNGISMLKKDTICSEECFINFSAKNGLKGNEINSIIQDERGIIWISTNSGLSEYDGSKFKSYSIDIEFNSNLTECLFLDYEDNLWIGTYSGLYKYRGNSFISFSEEEGLKNTFIFPILRDQSDNLWIGTYEGLYKYADNTFTVFTTKEGLPDNRIIAAKEDNDGFIWIGTDAGLSIYDPSVALRTSGKVFTNYFTEDGLISDSVSSILQDSRGNIWLGGHGGVSMHVIPDMKITGNKNETAERKIFKKFKFNKDNVNFDVWAILEDSKGNIWFGTYKGGVYMYDGNNFTDQRTNLGFESDVCLSILEDKQGKLWFGTFDGVFMYDPTERNGNKLTAFTEEDGLSSDLVYLMTIDNDEKYLWIGTNQGLNKLNVSLFRETGKKIIENYGKEEGFIGVECNANGVYKDNDGSIWFGTVNGLVKYDSEKYHPNKAESKTNITGFRIFYKDTILFQNAILPYNLNSIFFEYIGICLTNPQKVRYQYKLDGYDKEWSPVTKEKYATYANLPPGKYVFKVKSCNNEFKWNKDAATFSFIIATPFWKTGWFRVLALVIIAGIIWLGLFLRIQNIKRKIELDRKIDNLKLQALRSQMNPHFIFNSLNSIQHYINNNEKKPANIYLSKFADLIRLILENSQKSLVLISDNLKALKLYIELEQLRFENRFDYTIAVDPAIDIDYVKIPPMLIQPYVENALIHGLLPKPGKGEIHISLKRENIFVTCTVEDNGIGRKRSEELKKQNYNKLYKPAGMKLTKERIETLNILKKSNLSVEVTDLANTKGEPSGTRVKIYIPLL
ncbi:MAG: two-component regulator propeller domain-containing protein [Bacteroidota bacterium]